MVQAAKTVWITGSSRGIGKAIALCFAQAGCQVVLNANKSAQELAKTCQELQQAGYSCISLLGDVSDYKACQTMYETIKKQFGTIDILINNAGISHIGLFTDMTPENWDTLIKTNLYSVFNCTHFVVPDMVYQKSGVILNISSMWGERGASLEAVYSASKGGVNAFTKAMAKELGPSRIRVNAIACGVIETQMNACLTMEEQSLLREEISLLRFGTPTEVAKLAFFLCSEQAAFLTGQVLTLDGGML